MSDDHDLFPTIQELAEAQAQQSHTPETPKPIEGLDNTALERDSFDVAVEATHLVGDALVATGEAVLGTAMTGVAVGPATAFGVGVMAIPLAVSLESFPAGPCPATTCPTCSQDGLMSGGEFPCVMHAGHQDEHICAQGHNWF